MTDRQEIIIDSVDVSGCEFSTLCSNELKCLADDKDVHICLKTMEKNKCPIYRLKIQLQRKVAECEKLKKEIADLKTVSIMIDNNRYKQALDEIKGICSQDRTISDVRLICSQSEKHRVKYDIQDKILDIISRAKGAL